MSDRPEHIHEGALRIIAAWPEVMSETEWLLEREKGIGGSDAGTIAGVNRYNSALQLWSEKTHTIEREFHGNEATEWGHLLEDDIATKYARDYNKAIVEWPVLIWSLHPERGFMYANLDYVEVEPSEEFPAGEVVTWKKVVPPPNIIDIVECKTTGIATNGAAHHWENGGVPESYQVQGYHYGTVIDCLLPESHVTFVALVGGKGLQVRGMGRRPTDNLLWDDSIAENILIAEEQFWDLVTYMVEPEIDGSDATSSLIEARYPRSSEGKIYEGTAEFRELLEAFEAQKAAVKKATEEQQKLRSQIVAHLGDAEAAMVDGVLVATFKSGKERESFDAARFEKENPEMYKSYIKKSPGARTLLPKV